MMVTVRMRSSCLSRGRSQLFNLFIRRIIKHHSNLRPITSNILLPRLTPYADEITGVHQRGFGCDKSTTDHIFCIHQILTKKRKYSEAVHQPFIDIMKAYDSVRTEVLYKIHIPNIYHTTFKNKRREAFMPVHISFCLSVCLPHLFYALCNKSS
jgi:hypothetical protein